MCESPENVCNWWGGPPATHTEQASKSPTRTIANFQDQVSIDGPSSAYYQFEILIYRFIILIKKIWSNKHIDDILPQMPEKHEENMQHFQTRAKPPEY